MRALVFIAALGAIAACAAERPGNNEPVSVDAVGAIDGVYARWREAVEAADIPGYVSVLHPEVRMLPPGAPPVVGSGSYAAFLEPVFAAADYRIEVRQMPVVEVLGEWAVAEYEYVIHLALKDAQSGITEPGALTDSRTHARYFDVLRKTDAGTWGVWRHTWQVVAE